MSKGNSFFPSMHAASSNEFDVLPKYATMSFCGADTLSEWVTVAGALSTPVFLYVSDDGETRDDFAIHLSAACKLPVLNVSYDALTKEGWEKAVENVCSVFSALQNARIPAEQIVLIGRANGARLAVSALLRLAASDGPLPRCAIAVSPVIDAERARQSMRANEGTDPSPLSQRLAESCPLLVIAGDDGAAKVDFVQFAERAASAGIKTTVSSPGGFREVQTFVLQQVLGESSAQAVTPLTIQRVGWAGYVIVTEFGTRILIDPYQSGSEGFHSGLPESPIQPSDLFGVDLIAVTHAGFDHRGQSLEILRGGNAILACGPALYAEAVEQHAPMNRIAPMVSGTEIRCKDVTIKAVPARHSSSMEINGRFRSDQPLSFVVTTAAGTRIFCGGDSSISEDFKTWGRLYSPDIAILCIGGLWVGPIDVVELPPREAMLAASWLGVDTVIPVHYAPGDPAPLQLQAEVASAGLAIDVVTLDFGQVWTRPGKDNLR